MSFNGKIKIGCITLFRHALLALALFASGHLLANEAKEEGYRIGLTPVFLSDQTSFLAEWQTYLEKHLGKPVQFIRRQSYRQITEMLLQNQLDVAWFCGFPYVRNPGRVRLLVVPVYKGKPLYQSYIIVPAGDDKTKDITDLRGTVFAYSDPDSNSGYLVPQVQLRKAELDPARFFGKTFFTWNHKDVVVAVADGVAQGGAVDGYVWDTLSAIRPELTKKTRVVWRSEEFGFPPFVTRKSLPYAEYNSFRHVLKSMKNEPEGRRLLQRLNLDGFISGDDRLFDGIRSAIHFME